MHACSAFEYTRLLANVWDLSVTNTRRLKIITFCSIGWRGKFSSHEMYLMKCSDLFAVCFSHAMFLCLTPQANFFPFFTQFFDNTQTLCGNMRLLYWPSVTSRWLDIGPVLFMRCYATRRSRKTTRPISSHLHRASLVYLGFISWQKNCACIRIQNDLFISRAGKENQL